MNFLSNKKLLYVLAGIAIIVVVGLSYFAFFSSKNSNSSIEELDSKTILTKITQDNKLTQDSNLYSDKTNGTLSYSSSSGSFTLQLPKIVTVPAYNRDLKMELESYAANYLKISINQLCVIPFTVVSSDGEKLYTDVCIGEGV